MTYDEALEFWYGRINYEVRSAHPADLKLERMRALLRLLGDPQDRFRIVHVTGTKGKGSTAAMLAEVLQAAGYRVGLFTSPHLSDVRERMRVNGQCISREELAARMDEVAPAVLAMETAAGSLPPPTFFEIGTALGFLHFNRRRCDVAVVEVGLGGRFDSTNVCTPVVSVITNIGLDHMAQLGPTLEAIAFQKAGIIKRRVPVVSGVTHDGARRVIERVASENAAPIQQLGRAFRPHATLGELNAATGMIHPTRLSFYRSRYPWPTLTVKLLGEHQVTNAALAVATVEVLRDTGMPITDRAVAAGLESVRWPGRFEILGTRPLVVLDAAHNVPSAEALIQTLQRCITRLTGRKRLLFAVSSDKQYTEILRILGTEFDRLYLCRYGNNPRCVAPEKLAQIAAVAAPRCELSVHATSTEAWNAAKSEAKPEDLICITGSMFLVGELRPLLTASGVAAK